jgi:hypothetical protein
MNKAGPGIIGSFGAAAAKPIIQSAAGQNILHLSSGITPNIADWRVMDLEFDGLVSFANGLVGTGSIHRLTLLRLTMRNMQNGVQFSSDVLDTHNGVPVTAGHTIWDQLALVDSTVTAPATGISYGAFLSGDRVAVVGNAMDLPVAGAHVIRATYLGKAIISNNTLIKPSAGVNHAFKMHGPSWRTLPSVITAQPTNVEGNGVGNGYTRWVVISDNKFADNATDFNVVLGPQNNSRDERVTDIVFERNWLTSGAGNQYGLVLSATETTVRNNIFDMSGGTSSANIAILAFQDGIEPAPNQIRIFNNTGYLSGNNGGSDGFSLVNLRTSASNATVRNNLAYAPNAVAAIPKLLNDAGAAGTVASGNSSDAQVKNGPNPFSVGAPVSPSDFALGGASYAINSGVSVPVFSDFLVAPIVPRPNGAYDLGAREF